MKKYGVFDIMGPTMIGPSSSHTAGAARLGKMARYLCGGSVASVRFLLHGSFGQTYRGHGTDKALLAGMMGINSDDYRLRDAFSIADAQGLQYSFEPADLGDVHPNTVRFEIVTKDGRQISVTGSSIGGGSVVITQIDDISVYFTGENPILITKHKDAPGIVSRIADLLYRAVINIGNMRVNRADGAKTATMYIELDKPLDKQLIDEIRKIPGIDEVLVLDVGMEGVNHAL